MALCKKNESVYRTWEFWKFSWPVVESNPWDLFFIWWSSTVENNVNEQAILDAWYVLDPSSSYGFNRMEQKFYYKIVTSTNEQFVDIELINTANTTTHFFQILWLDWSDPIRHSVSNKQTSSSNTSVPYSTLISDNDWALWLYIGSTDTKLIEWQDRVWIRKVFGVNNCNVFLRTLNAGSNTSWSDSVPSQDEAITSSISFRDDMTQHIQPLEVTPIKWIEVIPDVLEWGSSDWEALIDSWDVNPLTGENFLSESVNFSNRNAQAKITIDGASWWDTCNIWDVVNFESSDTAKFLYIRDNWGWKYDLWIYDFTGSAAANNSSITCWTATGLVAWTSAYKDTSWLLHLVTTDKTKGKIFSLTGFSSVNLPDWKYFMVEEETDWYSFRNASYSYADNSDIVLTLWNWTGTKKEFWIIVWTQYKNPYAEDWENRNLDWTGTTYWNTNAVFCLKKYTAAKDLSLKDLYLKFKKVNASYANEVYFMSIDENWWFRTWLLDIKGWDRRNAILSIKSDETCIAESPSFDETKILYNGFWFRATTSSRKNWLLNYNQYEIQHQKITGGGWTFAIDFNLCKDYLNSDVDLNWEKVDIFLQTLFGSDFQLAKTVTIGDWSKQTFFNKDSQMISTPPQANNIDKFFYNVNWYDFNIDTSLASGVSTSTIITSDSWIKSTHFNDSTKYDGTTFIKNQLTLCDWKKYKGINIVKSKETTMSGASLELVNVTLSEPVIKNLDDGTETLKDVSFTDAVSYAIRMIGTWDFTLNNVKFQNSTNKDIHITATTGVVDLHIENNTESWSITQELSNWLWAAEDRFWETVEISKDWNIMAIWIPNFDEPETDTGIVKVYKKIWLNWTFLQSLTWSWDYGADFWEAISINEDWSTIVVWAKDDDTFFWNAWAVYVFYNDWNWYVEQAVLDSSVLSSNSEFWQSVSVSDDWNSLLVWDPKRSVERWLVTFFKRVWTTWTEEQTISRAGAEELERFWYKVKISGDWMTCALASPYLNSNTGIVTIYSRTWDTWTAQQSVEDDDPTTGSYFWMAMDLTTDWNILVVWAWWKAVESSQDWCGYIYNRDWITWSFDKRLIPEIHLWTDSFWKCVKISSDWVFVALSAPRRNAWKAWQWVIYLFNKLLWNYIESSMAKRTAVDSNEGFWNSFWMSWSWKTIVAGATGVDGEKTNTGAVYSLAKNTTYPSVKSDWATVNIDIPMPYSTAKVTNMVNWSRLRIFNETTWLETYNEIVTGDYVYNYFDWDNYSEWDTVRVYLTHTSWTTAKEDLSMISIVWKTGWTLFVEQVDNTVYNQLWLDWSSITGFSADYVDDEVDLTVWTDFNMSDLYAWWCYNMTTENGIREFFWWFEGINVWNFLIHNAIVDIKIDNTTATNIKQLDNRRIYRDDEVYPVKVPTTGGGGIDVVWRNTILPVNTGSALTAEEHDKLMLTSEEANATANKNELKWDIWGGL